MAGAVPSYITGAPVGKRAAGARAPMEALRCYGVTASRGCGHFGRELLPGLNQVLQESKARARETDPDVFVGLRDPQFGKGDMQPLRAVAGLDQDFGAAKARWIVAVGRLEG
jgi:hypothetical protein